MKREHNAGIRPIARAAPYADADHQFAAVAASLRSAEDPKGAFYARDLLPQDCRVSPEHYETLNDQLSSDLPQLIDPGRLLCALSETDEGIRSEKAVDVLQALSISCD